MITYLKTHWPELLGKTLGSLFFMGVTFIPVWLVFTLIGLGGWWWVLATYITVSVAGFWTFVLSAGRHISMFFAGLCWLIAWPVFGAWLFVDNHKN